MPLPEPVAGGHTYRLVVRAAERPFVSLVTMKAALAIELKMQMGVENILNREEELKPCFAHLTGLWPCAIWPTV